MLAINSTRSSALASGRGGADAGLTMPELTNLTDRISHLRDREGSSPLIPGGGAPQKPQNRHPQRGRPERRLATDYFMLFVYALLGIALVAQLGLIVWLDLV
jgi:nitrate reductase NapE component